MTAQAYLTTKLIEVEQEMSKAFNQWDEKIEAKQHPVSIQDLDYWIGVLRLYLKEQK